MMNAKREALLDQVINVFGFEHDVTIGFAKACECEEMTDNILEVMAQLFIENQSMFEEEEDE